MLGIQPVIHAAADLLTYIGAAVVITQQGESRIGGSNVDRLHLVEELGCKRP